MQSEHCKIKKIKKRTQKNNNNGSNERVQIQTENEVQAVLKDWQTKRLSSDFLKNFNKVLTKFKQGL